MRSRHSLFVDLGKTIFPTLVALGEAGKGVLVREEVDATSATCLHSEHVHLLEDRFGSLL